MLADKLKSGNKVLDVGSGSGYLTACIGVMLGDDGLAVGIDHIPELQQLAEKNIKNDKPDLLESGRVKLIGLYYLFILFIYLKLMIYLLFKLVMEDLVVQNMLHMMPYMLEQQQKKCLRH